MNRFILLLMIAFVCSGAVVAQEGTKNIIKTGGELYNGGTYLSPSAQTGIADFRINGEVGFTFYDASLKADIFAIDELSGFDGFLSVSPTFNWMRTAGNTKIDDQISGSSIDIESATGNIGLFNGVTNMGVTVGSEVIVTGTTTGGMQYNVPQTSFEPKSMVTKQYVDDEIALASGQQFMVFNAVLLNVDDPFPTTTTLVDYKGFIYIPDHFENDWYIERAFFTVGENTQDGSFKVYLTRDGSNVSSGLSFGSTTVSRRFNPNNTPTNHGTLEGFYHLRIGDINYTVPPSGLSLTLLLKKFQ